MTPLVPSAAWRRLLVVGAPTRIHPRVERLAAGATVDELDVHRLPRRVQACIWKSHMQYLRANPRDARYMAQVLVDWLGHAPPVEVDVLGDAGTCAAFDGLPAAIGTRHAVGEEAIPAEIRRRADAYDAVVLLYRDAIGLRWSQRDGAALASAATVVVLTGRRRAFRLDRATWRRLRRRRALELAWIAELALAPIVIAAGAALAARDALLGAPDGRDR